MNSIIRLITGLPGALFVTALIFVLLATVIQQDQNVELDDATTVEINVTRQLQDTQTQSAQSG